MQKFKFCSGLITDLYVLWKFAVHVYGQWQDNIGLIKQIQNVITEGSFMPNINWIDSGLFIIGTLLILDSFFSFSSKITFKKIKNTNFITFDTAKDIAHNSEWFNILVNKYDTRAIGTKLLNTGSEAERIAQSIAREEINNTIQKAIDNKELLTQKVENFGNCFHSANFMNWLKIQANRTKPIKKLLADSGIFQ